MRNMIKSAAMSGLQRGTVTKQTKARVHAETRTRALLEPRAESPHPQPWAVCVCCGPSQMAQVRRHLAKAKVVPPPEWFQALLTQGVMFLNT